MIQQGDTITVLNRLGEPVRATVTGFYCYGGTNAPADFHYAIAATHAEGAAKYSDEGTIWLPGWDAETVGALRATYNLSGSFDPASLDEAVEDLMSGGYYNPRTQ
jgi:hypothetical protein